MPLDLQPGSPVNMIRVVKGDPGPPGNISSAAPPLVVDQGVIYLDLTQLSAEDIDNLKGLVGPSTILKPNNESRINTVALADDADLKFDVLLGQKVTYKFRLFYSNPAASGGLAFSISKPAGVAQSMVLYLPIGVDATTFAPQYFRNLYSISVGQGVGSGYLEFDGILQASAAGQVKLQWAQAVSNAVGGTFYAGSSVTWEIVA